MAPSTLQGGWAEPCAALLPKDVPNFILEERAESLAAQMKDKERDLRLLRFLS